MERSHGRPRPRHLAPATSHKRCASSCAHASAPSATIKPTRSGVASSRTTFSTSPATSPDAVGARVRREMASPDEPLDVLQGRGGHVHRLHRRQAPHRRRLRHPRSTQARAMLANCAAPPSPGYSPSTSSRPTTPSSSTPGLARLSTRPPRRNLVAHPSLVFGLRSSTLSTALPAGCARTMRSSASRSPRAQPPPLPAASSTRLAVHPHLT